MTRCSTHGEYQRALPRNRLARISAKTRLERELVILGELIVRARERAGLRQSEVAATLGVPPSYLSKIENGTRRLDPIELIRIAEAIGVDPSEIVRELHGELRALKT